MLHHSYNIVQHYTTLTLRQTVCGLHQLCEGLHTYVMWRAGTPEYICAFWHSRAETIALSAILPRVAPSITPPWEARDRAWDDSSEDEQTQAAAAAAVPPAVAGSNGAVGSSGATSRDGLAVAAGGQQGVLTGEGSSGWAGLSAETSGTSTAAAAADEGVGVDDHEGEFALEGVDMEALRYLYYVSTGLQYRQYMHAVRTQCVTCIAHGHVSITHLRRVLLLHSSSCCCCGS